MNRPDTGPDRIGGPDRNIPSESLRKVVKVISNNPAKRRKVQAMPLVYKDLGENEGLSLNILGAGIVNSLLLY